MDDIQKARQIREMALPVIARRRRELIQILGEMELTAVEGESIIFLAATFALSEAIAWQAQRERDLRN